MTQKAYLYTVQVRKKREKSYQLLGDIEGNGATRLIDVLTTCLEGVETESEDGNAEVTSVPVAWPQGEEDGADELYAALRHGERDVAADIINSDGDDAYLLRRTDTSRVRCGCLFVLPPAQELGWLAIHSNSGRGVKGLLGPKIHECFRQRFDDLILEIKGYVNMAALQQAVDENHVRDVRLTKLVKPGDAADKLTNEWVPGGDYGKIEVKLTPRGRGKYLRGGPLGDLIHGNRDQRRRAARRIVRFEGLEFDEARVAVVLPDGSERTYYVQRDEPTGHPWALDIGAHLQYEEGNHPTNASIRDALRWAIQDVR